MTDFRFIDLHAHFPMHLGLPALAGEDPIHKVALEALYDFANEVDNYELINKPRVSAENVSASRISGFGSVLYDPEDEFLVKQEPQPHAFDHIQKQIEMVELEAEANDIEIVRSAADVDKCLDAGKSFIFHCMEGGHGLSSDPANVKRLTDQGVAYIILTHLRFMGLAGCAKGLPCKTDFWNNIVNQSQDPNVGLTPLGYEMLDAILASKALLDVTHCSDLSRCDIRKYCASIGSKRPLISSHTGCRALAHYELNVCDEWIRFIAHRGGVVGIILFPFWLSDDPKGKKGVDLVYQNIEHARGCGGDECVAVGTDLDGFIQPIKECKNYSNIPAFLQLLHDTYYDKQPEFWEKLTWRNARRVLLAALP